MEAERLAQFFLLPELLHHLIELTEQLAKFVRASGARAAKIDTQVSARDRIGSRAQFINWFGHEPAHHHRSEHSERDSDYAHEHGQPCLVRCR